MKNFSQNHPVICIILTILFVIAGTFLLLRANGSLIPNRIYNKILSLTHKTVETEIVEIPSAALTNIIEGKITEIKDNIAIIETDDSYFQIKLDTQSTNIVASSQDNSKINDPVSVGDNVEVKLKGSKFTSLEPYEVASITILR